MSKPTPVAVTTVCSECGLDWGRHGKNPTTADCIRLLKADLASATRPYVQPVVVPVQPWVQPYRPWGGPYWYGGTSGSPVLCGGGPQGNAGGGMISVAEPQMTFNTPQNAAINCTAVEVGSAA